MYKLPGLYEILILLCLNYKYNAFEELFHYKIVIVYAIIASGASSRYKNDSSCRLVFLPIRIYVYAGIKLKTTFTYT